MKANSHNTRGACEGCGQTKHFVMAVAFQGDGTATFRFLCASCERREKPTNEPRLFEAATYATVEEAEEAIESPVVRDDRQLALFTFSD